MKLLFNELDAKNNLKTIFQGRQCSKFRKNYKNISKFQKI